MTNTPYLRNLIIETPSKPGNFAKVAYAMRLVSLKVI